MKKFVIVFILALSSIGAYSQEAKQPEPIYDLKLTATEVSFLLQLVAEQPYKNVAGLMGKLQGQLAVQLQPADKTKGKPEGTGKPSETPKKDN